LALIGGGDDEVDALPFAGEIGASTLLLLGTDVLELGGRRCRLLDVGRDGKRGAGLFVADITSSALDVD
jgi:hypothetical protein